MMTADKTLPWLDLRDVCRILGQERERARQVRAGVPEDEVDVTRAAPLAEMTVRTYAYRQRRPGERRQYIAMRNEGRGFPAPVYGDGRRVPKPGDVPRWPIRQGQTREDIEQQFRVWYRNRPGPGAGGGRPRKAPVAPKPLPAGGPAPVRRHPRPTMAQLREEVAAGITPQSVLDAAIRQQHRTGRRSADD